MNPSSYNAFFMNFANKTKMAIIVTLMRGSLSATEISSRINEEQSKVSHNLRKLSHCNIIDVERKGKNRIYSLNKETVLPMLDIVEKHVRNHCKSGRCVG